MDIRIPPLRIRIKIMLESDPPKSIVLVLVRTEIGRTHTGIVRRVAGSPHSSLALDGWITLFSLM